MVCLGFWARMDHVAYLQQNAPIDDAVLPKSSMLDWHRPPGACTWEMAHKTVTGRLSGLVRKEYAWDLAPRCQVFGAEIMLACRVMKHEDGCKLPWRERRVSGDQLATV